MYFNYSSDLWYECVFVCTCVWFITHNKLYLAQRTWRWSGEQFSEVCWVETLSSVSTLYWCIHYQRYQTSYQGGLEDIKNRFNLSVELFSYFLLVGSIYGFLMLLQARCLSVFCTIYLVHFYLFYNIFIGIILLFILTNSNIFNIFSSILLHIKLYCNNRENKRVFS